MTITILAPNCWASVCAKPSIFRKRRSPRLPGITVRTVQRFEAGEGVQIGSHRSLPFFAFLAAEVFFDEAFLANFFAVFLGAFLAEAVLLALANPFAFIQRFLKQKATTSDSER
jgi:hypothetical protein